MHEDDWQLLTKAKRLMDLATELSPQADLDVRQSLAAMLKELLGETGTADPAVFRTCAEALRDLASRMDLRAQALDYIDGSIVERPALPAFEGGRE
ncbi:hypothetical protein F0L68_34675 [Solihabitans fulvus]|uniref:Uncharacterized protein n=1 Tax=Solihabitans fulvus TaxID=1892852 RepID=A0A5B2WRS8_9PSEU|nr:hypothetical protein [Solihabitans fulvus]KAA2252667.1 hypothetical protein F0L68_34675 [Solihabitans fulvus]